MSKRGPPWLPLDTGYPDDRLRMMLEDARPSLLITSEDQLARFSDIPGLESLCYQQPLAAGDDAPLALSKPDHTAYIIFTSGSTGRPKGVMVRPDRHRQPPAVDAGSLSVIWPTTWWRRKRRAVSTFPVWEFWWPFIAGAQLVMAEPEAHRDPQAMQQFFARYGVTTHHFVAVDAGGVCRLAGCRQRGRLPHAAAGIPAAKRCRRNCAASGSA
ncbi:AMP-binding protein [Klebsiella pneumoniae subsp. pneumoniae]|nr:AMP-binding protein [Klebsiella pneumoniae subsp. pneumoniae]